MLVLKLNNQNKKEIFVVFYKKQSLSKGMLFCLMDTNWDSNELIIAEKFNFNVYSLCCEFLCSDTYAIK